MIVRGHRALIVAVLACVAACGAPRCGEPAPSADASPELTRPPEVSASHITVTSSVSPCFSVVASRGSARTAEVFREHGLHGGGPTWIAILQAVVLRHGQEPRPLEAPPPGYPGFGAAYAIDLAGGPSWFTLDDEADAAVFCAPDARLRAAVKADVERADRDDEARARAIAEAAAFADELE